MIEASADIKKIERKYLPKDLMDTSRVSDESYSKELLDREIDSTETIQQWSVDMSEREEARKGEAGGGQKKRSREKTETTRE